jgi:hypothetical protein
MQRLCPTNLSVCVCVVSQLQQVRNIEERDASSETHLALTEAHHENEQLRQQLHALQQSVDSFRTENQRLLQRLQRELACDELARVRPAAADVGAEEQDRSELQRLRREVQDLRTGTLRYADAGMQETIPASAEAHLSAFVLRSKEKRRRFKDMMTLPTVSTGTTTQGLPHESDKLAREHQSCCSTDEMTTSCRDENESGILNSSKSRPKQTSNVADEFPFQSSAAPVEAACCDQTIGGFFEVHRCNLTPIAQAGVAQGQEMQSPQVAAAEALPNASPAHLSDSCMETAQSDAALAAATAHAVVSMTLKLGASSAVGEEGSARRAVFKINLVADLARAAGIKKSFFEVKRVSAGSIVVDVDILSTPQGCSHTPLVVAADLEKQARDPSSILLAGALTAKLVSVDVPSLAQGKYELPQTSSPQYLGEESPSHRGVHLHKCVALRQGEPKTDDPQSLFTASKQMVVGTRNLLADLEDRTVATAPQLVVVAGKGADLERDKAQGQTGGGGGGGGGGGDFFTIEEALEALQQRLETKFTQLIWRQMQAHEQVVQDLLALIRFLQCQG